MDSVMTPRYDGKRRLVLDRYYQGLGTTELFSKEETDDLAMFLLPRAREIEDAHRRATELQLMELQLKHKIDLYETEKQTEAANGGTGTGTTEDEGRERPGYRGCVGGD